MAISISSQYSSGKQEALARFGVKVSTLQFVVPSVAGGILGRKGGEALGRAIGMPGLLGDVVGPIVGTSLGMSLGRDLEARKASKNPQLQLDPTDQSIPPWALSLAQAAQPILKQGSDPRDLGLKNMLLENIIGPALPFREGYRKGGIGGALRTGGGAALGGLAGTAGGILAGKAIENALGSQPKLMGISIPHVLGGLGGILGGTKAFEALI